MTITCLERPTSSPPTTPDRRTRRHITRFPQAVQTPATGAPLPARQASRRSRRRKRHLSARAPSLPPRLHRPDARGSSGTLNWAQTRWPRPCSRGLYPHDKHRHHQHEHRRPAPGASHEPPPEDHAARWARGAAGRDGGEHGRSGRSPRGPDGFARASQKQQPTDRFARRAPGRLQPCSTHLTTRRPTKGRRGLSPTEGTRNGARGCGAESSRFTAATPQRSPA